MDQTNWFNRNIFTKDSVRTMSNYVTDTVLKRQMDKIEMQDFIKFLGKNKTANWNLHKAKYGDGVVPAIQKLLVKNYINSRYTPHGRNKVKKDSDAIDIHETLKLYIGTTDQDADVGALSHVNSDGLPITRVIQHVADDDEEEVGTLGALENVNTIGTIGGLKNLENVQQLFGKSDPTSLQLLVNPEAAYKHNYIMMDSRYRKTDTFGIQEQSWNFLSNSTINATGAVNSLGSVKNIVAMTVPELRLPFKDSIILNGYKRVSLLIKEFSGQSHVAQETRKFHFMFKTVVDGNNIDLIPLKYGNQEAGTFNFVKPVTQIDTLTLTWGNPLEPIIFDKDRLIFTVNYANPATFTSTEEHKLFTGDLVYIQDFTTNDTATDGPIISTVNSIYGHNIVKIDDFNFAIDLLDLTAVTAPIAAQTMEIYFGSNRIFVPIDFKFIYTPD